MPTLRFEGYSDDTFGEYSHFNEDYDCCASGAMIVFQVSAGGETLNVCGQYNGDKWPREMPACWIIGVQPADEDVVQLPEWPMRFELGKSGYSPALLIEVPDGVTVKCLNVERD